MKQLLIFAALVFVVWACGGSETAGASSSSTSAAKPKVAQIDGKKIYRQNCVTCHGLKGDMGASGAHDLTASELGLEERKIVIAKGRGVMTPFEGVLSPEKIAAVAKYTLELKN
ncbi:MAG: cytochrome c [Bacteroidota bacterium]